MLTRQGYRRKHMTEQFDTKAAEIRARILAVACRNQRRLRARSV